MAYALYINDINERARLHDEDCNRVHQHGKKGGDKGEYRYFEDYDDAWNYMNRHLDDYDCDDCQYCNPS